MSVARLALRISALQAIKDRTFVAGNVRDSDMGAIDIAGDGALKSSADAPFVVIYTDDSKAEETGLRDLRQTGMLDLVLEFGITAAMFTLDKTTGVSSITGPGGVSNTDAGFEATLDLIDRQVVSALTDPDNEWAELWRRLSDKVVKVERKRAVNAEDGNRLAFRQVRMTLAVKPDPVAGQPLADSSVWSSFKALVDRDVSDLSDMVSAMLGLPGVEVTYGMLQRSRGNTAGEARALGYAPFYPSAPDALIKTPIVTETISGGGSDVDPA